jgi:endonuclease/exonuclease/phosphatase family metal-dependent hydrolase
VSRGSLRLVSYNLHEFIGRDGRIAPDLVRSALARLDADVIAVQEFQALRADLSPFQSLGAWGRSLEMTPIAGFTLQRSGGHYGSAVLARLPVRSVRRHDLSVFPHEPRGALEVHLKWGDAMLRLFATHLGLRWRERRRQVRQLARLLREEESMPTLLMGDLNDWTPGSLQLRPLWRHLPQRSRAATFPARLPLLTLDCIAASAELPWRCSRVETAPPFRSISDHLPVVAEIGDEEPLRPGMGLEDGPRRDAPTARPPPRPTR